jgi:hypothetical protein
MTDKTVERMAEEIENYLRSIGWANDDIDYEAFARALTRQAQVSDEPMHHQDLSAMAHMSAMTRGELRAGETVSDNAVTPAMIDAALVAWDSSEGDDRGRMWNAIERAMQASATNSEAVSERWESVATAPAAITVLAARFDNDCGEWIYAVILSPPSHPFTHWRLLPEPPKLGSRAP